MLGTDAGTPYNRHGDNAHELELMVRYGASPEDALCAATRNGAELLGWLDELGTVEPGKQADLVVCQGDAVADPARLAQRPNLLAVIQAGRPLDPAQL